MSVLAYPSLYGDVNVDVLFEGDNQLRYLLEAEPVAAASNDVTVSASCFVGVQARSSPTVEVSATSRVLAGVQARSSPTVEVSVSGLVLVGAHPRSSSTVDMPMSSRVMVGVGLRSSPVAEVTATSQLLVGAVLYSAVAPSSNVYYVGTIPVIAVYLGADPVILV